MIPPNLHLHFRPVGLGMGSVRSRASPQKVPRLFLHDTRGTKRWSWLILCQCVDPHGSAARGFKSDSQFAPCDFDPWAKSYLLDCFVIRIIHPPLWLLTFASCFGPMLYDKRKNTRFHPVFINDGKTKSIKMNFWISLCIFFFYKLPKLWTFFFVPKDV